MNTCPYWNNDRCTFDPKGVLCECAPNKRAHGVICLKKSHDRLDGGYLHAETDDTPYDVDGVQYCGRCHQAL